MFSQLTLINRSVGFSTKVIPLVLCPQDNGTLRAEFEPDDDRIQDGRLICRSCASSFEIRDGILHLLPAQAPLARTIDVERQARDSGAVEYEAHFSEEENASELHMLTSHSQQFRGKRILDLGCGTGRLMRTFVSSADAAVGVDLSEASLRQCAQRLAPGSTIGLIWANAVDVRFAKEAFDVVVSTQVLEHLPSFDLRVSFLRQIHSALKPGGALLLTAYYYSWARRILRRLCDCCHANGIFYHRFTAAEIRRGLGKGYEMVEFHPLQPDRRILSKLRWPRLWRFEPVFERLLAALVGQLIYVRAVKTLPQSLA